MRGPIDEIEHTTSLGAWSLKRAQPDADFAGIVKEYWEVKGRLSPFREALLPNGFAEIMFQSRTAAPRVRGPSHTAVITQVDLLLEFVEPFLKGETPKGFGQQGNRSPTLNRQQRLTPAARIS